MRARPKSTCASPRRRRGTAASTASTRPSARKLLAANMDLAEMTRLHPRRQPGVRLDRRAVQGAGRARPRRHPPQLLRRLLHRRLSDDADRPGRERAGRPVRAAGGAGRLILTRTAVTKAPRRPLALVTGASRGIGAATAEALAAARRARRPHRPHRRRAGGGRGSDPRRRRHRDDRAARPDRERQHRQARRTRCASAGQALDMLVLNAGDARHARPGPRDRRQGVRQAPDPQRQRAGRADRRVRPDAAQARGAAG